jgi:hypothetical protein
MHRLARYAAPLAMIAMLGYAVHADVPQVPTRLLDGHVLVAGGNDAASKLSTDARSTGAFALTVSLNTPRSGHVAILLPHNNEVLIAGGTSNGNALASVERFLHWYEAFLPDANTMATPRSGGVSVPTSRYGVVLVAGGARPSQSSTALQR